MRVGSLSPLPSVTAAIVRHVNCIITSVSGPLSPAPSLAQGSTPASAIKDHVVKHALPLVGHRKTSNDAKRYTKRPLVVVYYTVDFSFDYRTGEGAGTAGVAHLGSCQRSVVARVSGLFPTLSSSPSCKRAA